MTYIKPWLYVYRVIATNDNDEEWTRRLTEQGAREAQVRYENLKAYAVKRGRSFNKRVTIERAPIGEWETVYDSEDQDSR